MRTEDKTEEDKTIYVKFSKLNIVSFVVVWNNFWAYEGKKRESKLAASKGVQ